MKRISTQITLAILAMVLFTVVPLYFMLQSFLEKSLEIGVNARVEQALDSATRFSRQLYQQQRIRLAASLQRASATIGQGGLAALSDQRIAALQGDFAALQFAAYDMAGKAVAVRQSPRDSKLPAVFQNQLHQVQLDSIIFLDTGSAGHLVAARVLGLRPDSLKLVAIAALPVDLVTRASQVVEVNQMVKTIGLLKEDLQSSFLLAFFLFYVPFALLALVAGLFFARRISRPVQALAEGTRKVARGDWNVQVPAQGSGEMAGLTAAFNGMVHELRGQRDQLVELEKKAAWREMARVLAHEIKNPLTPIQLTVQQLNDKYTGEDASYGALLQECTQIIGDEIQSLQRLVSAFSQFARLPEPALQPGDLNSLIREVAGLYPSAELKLDLQENLPELQFDADQLRRVLINFIENSLASMNGSAMAGIKLTTRVTEQSILLEVADRGSGIAPERLEKIFEPYYSTKKGGMGLGLAVVRDIIHGHGGSIQVESSPGQGTCFHVRLPILHQAGSEQ